MWVISDNIITEQLLYEDFQSDDKPPANYQSPLEMSAGCVVYCIAGNFQKF